LEVRQGSLYSVWSSEFISMRHRGRSLISTRTNDLRITDNNKDKDTKNMVNNFANCALRLRRRAIRREIDNRRHGGYATSLRPLQSQSSRAWRLCRAVKAAFHDTDSPDTPMRPYVRHARLPFEYPRKDVGVSGESRRGCRCRGMRP